jgi:hypothetical protein
LISEVTIMTVFAVTFIIIIRLSKTLAKMSSGNAVQTETKEKTDE